MNGHNDIRRLLAPYSSSELPAGERQSVDEHLQSCAVCRSELADLQLTLRLIRSTPEIEPPPWLTTRIMARVQESAEQSVPWYQKIINQLRFRIPLQAIALLVVCMTGYYLMQNMESELNPAAPQKLRDTPPPAVEQKIPETQKRDVTSERAMPRPDTSLNSVQQKLSVEPDKPVAPAAAPVYAPPPPSSTGMDSSADTRSAVESRTVGAPPNIQSKAELSDRIAESAAPAMKKKTARRAEQRADFAAQPPSPAGSMAGESGEEPLPRVTIRLSLLPSTRAPAVIRDVVIRTGGVIVEETSSVPQRLRVRMPTPRIDELLDRLGAIGRIVEKPSAIVGSGTVEVIISWSPYTHSFSPSGIP
ncbi:MAG: DUF2275 domain-containing protein [Desulfuromonadales bacterium]